MYMQKMQDVLLQYFVEEGLVLSKQINLFPNKVLKDAQCSLKIEPLRKLSPSLSFSEYQCSRMHYISLVDTQNEKPPMH